LRRVEVTCDDENEASRRVILKNGGTPAGSRMEAGGRRKLVFHIDLLAIG
jgi:predicted acetyltransferase